MFLLIAPPFIPADEQDSWLLKSVDFAEACGASVISLVPTRAGNGAMEALTAQGLFREPTRLEVERSFALVASRTPSNEQRATRVFLDPWAAHAS